MALFPAGNLPLFSGLPLTGIAEFAPILLAVPLMSRTMRRALTAGWPARARRLPAIAAILLGVALIAKVALLAGGAHSGWHACYHPVDVRQTASGCERSFANPFFLESATRFDEDLDFGLRGGPGPSGGVGASDWNLSFLNSLRWNVADPPDFREHIPFSVRWSGDAVVDSGGRLVVSYVGEGTIRVGARTARLPAAYAGLRTARLTGFPKRGHAVIRFAFRPPSTSSSMRGPYAAFELAGVHPRGATTAQQILRWLVDVPLLVITLALLAAYLRLVGTISVQGSELLVRVRDGWWLGVLGVVLILLPPFGDSQTPTRACLALIVILGAMAIRPSRRALFLAGALVVLANALWVAHDWPVWDLVVYRVAENDPLSYESFARDFLETWSLRGSEDVFFGQPGSRYILFVVRMIVGDSDPALALVARTAQDLGVLAAIWIACRHAAGQPIARTAAFAAGACALVVLTADTQVVQLIDVGLSESPAWAGIPVATAALIFARDRRWVLAATVVLGICAITRTEYVPVITVIAAVGLIRWASPDRRWAITCAAVYAALLMLPLLHNVVYGHQVVLFTTSSGANTVLPLSEIPDALSDSDVRSELEHQIRGVVYAAPESNPTATRLAVRLLQAAWLIATLVALVRWRATSLTTKALLVSPALALGPYVVYDVFNHYPRHIVGGYLLMATVLAVAAALELDGRRRRFSEPL